MAPCRRRVAQHPHGHTTARLLALTSFPGGGTCAQQVLRSSGNIMQCLILMRARAQTFPRRKGHLQQLCMSAVEMQRSEKHPS